MHWPNLSMPSEWLAASKNSRQLAAYVGAAQSLPSLAVAVVPVGGARSATLEWMNALSPGEGGARAHLVSHHYRLHTEVDTYGLAVAARFLCLLSLRRQRK
jgi:hypothetical protein